MIETQVGDEQNNIKGNTISYYLDPSYPWRVARFGLVQTAEVYDREHSTVVKRSVTEYNLDSNYIDRRIIGLPSMIEAWGWNQDPNVNSLEKVSKVTYAYDENGYENGQGVTATQHDSGNYGTSFPHRGNLTSTTRWDVPAETSPVTFHVKYNITGSPISRTDPLGRISTILYDDNFNSNGNPTTYAYPTKIYDPAENYSEIKYRYDFGSNVWERSPKPDGPGNSNGKTTSRKYSDTTGRIEKEKIENPISGAYTRYVYPESGTELTTYTTIVDVEGTSEYVNVEDEVRTDTLFDGAGRTIKTRTENPVTTGGAYIGKLVEYDILGRVKGETVPTEMNSSWQPAGDDYRGPDKWLWNWKRYDWKGRVTMSIPSDSTTNPNSTTPGDKDTIFAYEGCGCAGGQVTTISGPNTQAIDMNAAGPTPTPTTGRRVQKIREDILGRTVATEVWSLNGGSLYSTTINYYNGRDQVAQAIQIDSSTNANQATTFEYDGHGRLKRTHRPEYAASTFTTTTYNIDDTVATVTDPRGASMTYTYETIGGSLKRPLVTNIHYSTPNPNATPGDPRHVADVPDVTFQYDKAGNRTSMTDGTGELTYTYDELSRMKTETKDFLDNLSGAPSGVYTLTYNYHLAGGIKSITEPFGNVVTYSVDKLGRMTGIGDASIPTKYAQEIKHRAFGAVKEMELSATQPIEIEYGYDNALRLTNYLANSAANATDIHNSAYAYNNDGMLGSIDNQADAKFDQTNTYDFAGRLRKNDTGIGAIGDPFFQRMNYDAFNNLTYRWTRTYQLLPREFNATYENNRKTLGGSDDTYDAAGNVVQAFSPGINNNRWEFDAAGRSWHWYEHGAHGDFTMKGGKTVYDGDGRAAKKIALSKHFVNPEWEEWNEWPSYDIYSSVTGQKITELDNTGASTQFHVYMGSTEIANVTANASGIVYDFHVNDPVTGSMWKVGSNGVKYPDTNPENAENENRTEIVGLATNVPPRDPNENMPGPNYEAGGWVGGPENGCADADGVPISCNRAVIILRVLEGSYRIVGGSANNRGFNSSMPFIFPTDTDDNIPYGVIQEIKNLSYENGLTAQYGSPTLVNWYDGKAKLNEKDQKQYDKKRGEVRKRLEKISKKCLDFLTKAGLSVNDVLNAVDLQNAYDGENSTISMLDAGYYELAALSPDLDPQTRASYLAEPVNRFVKKNAKAATMLFPGGVATKLDEVEKRSDVYFRIDYGGGQGFLGLSKGYGDNSGFTQTTILHEALHSLTGLSDPPLYTKLTGRTAPPTGMTASSAISQALENNGCTK